MSISRHQAVGAYRRWQPPDFDAPDRPEGADAPSQPAAAPPPPKPAPVEAPEPAHDDFAGLQLPTAEDIERMHDEARAAGFEEGRSEGYAAGLEAGRAEGLEEGRAGAEEHAARLAALAEGFDQAMTQLDNEVAEELMALAIELARQMVRHTLDAHPEVVLETVRAALLQVPQGHAQVRLHPDDLALAREHLGEQLSHAGHRLTEDATLARGDCRIDALGAQVDATLETRWRRVLETLGRERPLWAPAEPAAGGMEPEQRRRGSDRPIPRKADAAAPGAQAATNDGAHAPPDADPAATASDEPDGNGNGNGNGNAP